MSEKLINFPWKRRSNKADPYDFVQLFEKETIIPMRSYCNDSIIETAKGRYDVRTSMVKREFEEVPANPTIARLMKQCLKDRYLCDIGLLVTGTHAKVSCIIKNETCRFCQQVEQVILANLKLLLPKSVQDLKNMRSIYSTKINHMF